MKIILSKEEYASFDKAKSVLVSVLESEGIAVGTQNPVDDYHGISVSRDEQENTVIKVEHDMIADYCSMYQKLGILLIRAGVQVISAFKKIESICEGFDNKWTKKKAPATNPYVGFTPQPEPSVETFAQKQQIGFITKEVN